MVCLRFKMRGNRAAGSMMQKNEKAKTKRSANPSFIGSWGGFLLRWVVIPGIVGAFLIGFMHYSNSRIEHRFRSLAELLYKDMNVQETEYDRDDILSGEAAQKIFRSHFGIPDDGAPNNSSAPADAKKVYGGKKSIELSADKEVKLPRLHKGLAWLSGRKIEIDGKPAGAIDMEMKNKTMNYICYIFRLSDFDMSYVNDRSTCMVSPDIAAIYWHSKYWGYFLLGPTEIGRMKRLVIMEKYR